MNNEMPYWYKLISNWISLGNDGLTIPFILGARRRLYFDEGFRENEIYELLADIKNSDFDKHIIRFYECHKIGEKVLGLFSKLNSNLYQGVKFLNKAKKNSFAIGNEVKLGKTIEEISLNLNGQYKKPIEEKRFSLVAYKWVPFTKKDETFITDALSINL